MTQTIEIRNNHFVLHPLGGAYWQEKEMLLIADVHLGKATHFRKEGIAIPLKTMHKNYFNLDKLIEYFKPKTISFLGDLFHSKINKEWLYFEDWCSEVSAKLILIKGNHDIIAEEKFKNLDILLMEDWQSNSFFLTHHPEEAEGVFNICGHVHPGIHLKGPGRQKLKLPCFYQTENQLILPAFGDFTGNFSLKPTKKDKVFAVTPDEVILVSG
ncbi:ligase-associated DNA damage response endonuclease PdeM [Galbibacter sp. BG1]|uniref:ligase-associated DNA damage response endonuclease PdeM n=1 Tax=Galbibacter sp. BG1 TaxID=1170699 RepID=UPI0015BF702A|nr:ligase-associated DNA damage response endonuclease PdeM [Galbibacter sp. BG1]QLE01026.1 ligase-associated DNA damage response endonuclease PdeM [Galbibacter sp. BG1]